MVNPSNTGSFKFPSRTTGSRKSAGPLSGGSRHDAREHVFLKAIIQNNSMPNLSSIGRPLLQSIVRPMP